MGEVFFLSVHWERFWQEWRLCSWSMIDWQPRYWSKFQSLFPPSLFLQILKHKLSKDIYHLWIWKNNDFAKLSTPPSPHPSTDIENTTFIGTSSALILTSTYFKPILKSTFNLNWTWHKFTLSLLVIFGICKQQNGFIMGLRAQRDWKNLAKPIHKLVFSMEKGLGGGTSPVHIEYITDFKQCMVAKIFAKMCI